jgi:hypothetical protein
MPSDVLSLASGTHGFDTRVSVPLLVAPSSAKSRHQPGVDRESEVSSDRLKGAIASAALMRGRWPRPPGRDGGAAAVRGEGRLEDVEKTCNKIGSDGKHLLDLGIGSDGVGAEFSDRFGHRWLQWARDGHRRLDSDFQRSPAARNDVIAGRFEPQFMVADLRLSGLVVPIAHI